MIPKKQFGYARSANKKWGLHMFKRFGFSAIVLCACVASGAQAAEVWSTGGFANPESVEYDPAHIRYYVSNVDGDPTATDGQGFISLLGEDGTMIDARWVEGLNAPKGLVFSDGILYAADIDHLVVIDVESGTVTGRYPAEGAQFLNDVDIANDGRVFVTDMFTNAIYAFDGDSLDLWLRSDDLWHPNGIRFDGNRLIIAAWGDEILDDFSTPTPGHLIAVDLNTQAISALGSGAAVGNLDGIARDGHGNWLVSDWLAGALYRIDASGNAEMLMDLDQGSADIDVVAHRDGTLYVVVPMMNDNRVVSYSIE
jgi:DNA-binding beta-propeller fold protein YncE